MSARKTQAYTPKIPHSREAVRDLDPRLVYTVQSVQNATARLITGTRRSDHIRELHWLPIRQSVKFKVVCVVRQSLSGQAPLYWLTTSMIHLVSDSTRRPLWSADVLTCIVPRTLSSYGDRTFADAGPRLWNSLTVQLRNLLRNLLRNPDVTYGLFRRQLKGHLFREARTRRSVTSDTWRHRKTLTYLLTYMVLRTHKCLPSRGISIGSIVFAAHTAQTHGQTDHGTCDMRSDRQISFMRRNRCDLQSELQSGENLLMTDCNSATRRRQR